MKAPYNIANHRREQCKLCPTPCEFQHNREWREEGDNACPKGKFMAYVTYERVRWKGAGDAVASVAQPIAGALDKMAKVVGKDTNFKGCGACKKRKEMLNQLIPFIKK